MIVHMPVVNMVKVPIMQIVRMPVVTYSNVATLRPVNVHMIAMGVAAH